MYANPELDKIIGQAEATSDDAKRAELIKKAVKIIHEEVASIPLFNFVTFYAMKQNVDFKPTLKYNQDLVLVKDVTLR